MPSPYARRRSSGGSAYAANRAPSTAPAPAKKKGHGFFHRFAADILNAAVQSPGAVKEIATGPAMGVKATYLLATGHHDAAVKENAAALAHDKALVKTYAEGLKQDVTHPLRHPGNSFLDAIGFASLGAGGLAKAGAIRTATKAGGVKAGAKAAVAPTPVGKRVLNVDGMNVRGHYSHSASSRAVQKTADKLLTKGAGMDNRVGQRVENQLHRRAAKWQDRNLRVGDAVAAAPGTRVAALERKLKPEELRALRLVAEEVPVARRLGAQEMRKARATHPKEQARHQERIDLTAAAQGFLHEVNGKPAFKPEAKKLAYVYDRLKAASVDRGEMLKHLDLMDEAALQASKTKVARIAAGGTYEKPTPGKLGMPTPGLKRSQARVVSLEGRLATNDKTRTPKEAAARLAELERKHAKQIEVMAKAWFGPIPKGDSNFRTHTNKKAAASGTSPAWKARPTMAVERARLTEKMADEKIAKLPPDSLARKAWEGRMAEMDSLRVALNPEFGVKVKRNTLGRVPGSGDPARKANLEGALAIAREELARNQKAAATRQKPTGVVGANDITASPDAVFIGNPVERGKLTGRPKVSSTGTLGHTRKPSSLKTATGGSVAHALERNDVTNIVAERHREVVRLSSIHRRVAAVKAAGKAAPTRKDDVWVWTDKTVSNERIPKDVREFLDNPDGIAKLPEGQQQSMLDQIKASVLERHNWETDGDKLAAFEKLAQEGKGVFVPRRLLGDAGKRSYNAGDSKGIKFIDNVNNAQKAGLVYLKVNYPIVQALSNTAMNVIHQGFAAPVNITRAVRLERTMGPEGAAVVDDIMGGGAVMQAAFEGQGAISTMTRNLAHAMSSKVDTPARRAAFLHEAHKAGYGTPEKMKALIENDKHAGDLAEVAQRAKEAIVDYSEMSPFEKQIIRRLIFVYPWQRGATKFAGHFLRDHPVQAAALGMLGEQGAQISDNTFGPVPSYLKGIVDIGGGAVNPAGVNFFQTPAQIGQAVVGTATGNPAQRGAGLSYLSPFPGIVAGLFSGHNDIGVPLKSNVLGNTRDLTYGQTPLAGAIRSLGADHSDLLRKAVGSKNNSKTFPDKNDALWRFLFGGLYPRDYSKPALNQNAAREKSGR